jgi:hypothetical protein
VIIDVEHIKWTPPSSEHTSAGTPISALDPETRLITPGSIIPAELPSRRRVVERRHRPHEPSSGRYTHPFHEVGEEIGCSAQIRVI